MAFSDVATVGFVFRNGQKVSNGDAGRIPVLVGQAVKAEYIWKNEETDESDVSISTVNRIYKKLLNI